MPEDSGHQEHGRPPLPPVFVPNESGMAPEGRRRPFARGGPDGPATARPPTASAAAPDACGPAVPRRPSVAVLKAYRRSTMQATWWFGRVSGVRVGAHWSVLVLLLMVSDVLSGAVLPAEAPGYSSAAYWTAGSVGALLLVAAVLGHELAHVRVAQRSGVPVTSVTLWMLGGVSLLGQDAPDADTELRVALAGPASSAVISAGLALSAGVAAASG